LSHYLLYYLGCNCHTAIKYELFTPEDELYRTRGQS